jgi:nitrogen fixation NifU-like protein
MSATYDAIVLEHFRRPRNRRRLDAPTTAREGFNPLCGDRVRIELAVSDGVIADAAFTANACAICTASVSMLTERVKGLTPGDVVALSEEYLLADMGAVPAGRRGCATLPLRTLREALSATTAT